jgi:hypothetical protein
MPNGFHGPIEEWAKLEAPYLRIDPILTAFAERHALELQKNYRGADRSFRWNDGLNRDISIASMDKYGARGTYRVSIGAYEDRGSERYWKHGIVADDVGIDALGETLERARRIVLSWSMTDLHLSKGGGEELKKL